MNKAFKKVCRITPNNFGGLISSGIGNGGGGGPFGGQGGQGGIGVIYE